MYYVIFMYFRMYLTIISLSVFRYKEKNKYGTTVSQYVNRGPQILSKIKTYRC